jgi:hypothetical protein
MQSAPNFQSMFLDMLCSSSAGYLPPFSEVEGRHAEAVTSASKLEAYLQAVPAEHFQKKHDIIQ